MKRKKYRQILYCIFVMILILMGLFLRKKEERTSMAGNMMSDNNKFSGIRKMGHNSERDRDGNAVERSVNYADEIPPRIALTFDDGPHPAYTEKLLEGLRERGVKATFFVVGENIPGNEKLIAQMEEDGHLIGNHTYDHADISKLSDKENCMELQKTSALVKEITGHDTAYVRPPFGNWKDSMDCKVSMIAVKWTIDTLDWQSRNVAEIVNKVMRQVSDHDIILMHDYYSTSVEAALQIVDQLKKQGYEFVTVEDLILE